MRRIGRAALFVLITLAVAELALRLGALVVHDRASGWRPGAIHRIVCVGDSHTYGALVEPEESYPAQLQRFLDERIPGAYAVTNLGVPGMNTTQVLNRLPVEVGRLRPQLVIVWAGINDAWNRAEANSPGWWPRLDGLASRSRVYRFVRVWLHDRRLERDFAEAPEEGERHDVEAHGIGPETIFTVRHGGVVERLKHQEGDKRSDEELEKVATRDYEAMVRWAHAAGVPIVLIAYPVQWNGFVAVNRAMGAVAARYDVPLLDSPKVLQRIPREQRPLLWGGHPGPAVYREIARDLVPIVVAATGGPPSGDDRDGH